MSEETGEIKGRSLFLYGESYEKRHSYYPGMEEDRYINEDDEEFDYFANLAEETEELGKTIWLKVFPEENIPEPWREWVKKTGGEMEISGSNGCVLLELKNFISDE